MEASLNGPLGSTALGLARVTIGRSQDNGLVVNDPKTSSHHAEIRPDGSSYSIVDLGSTNGTFVNERKLDPGAPRLLQPGDTIRIGDTSFSFEVRGLSQPGAYSTSGLTVRDVPPALNVSTNFGEYYAGTPSGNSETWISANASNPDSLSTLPPVPAGYTPSQYTPLPPVYEPTQYRQDGQAPYTGPQSPVSLPAPQSQYGQAQGQYSGPQAPLSPLTSPPPVQRPRSLAQIILIAAIVLVLIIGGLSSFFVIHNNQVAQQNANATATANANATGTAQALANATGTAVANANATATAIANATATAIAHANATATAMTMSQYPPFSILALNDSLTSTSASGWSTGTQCQFMSTGYQVSIARTGFDQGCLATSTNFGDFAYQVTMTIVQGDCGGLIFRAVNAQNYYAFLVCQNGKYIAALFVNTAVEKSPPAATSSAIHTGLQQVNTLAVVLQGNTFNLYVNGQRVDTFPDSTFTHGAVGVLAADINSPTAVDYTNALVWTAS